MNLTKLPRSKKKTIKTRESLGGNINSPLLTYFSISMTSISKETPGWEIQLVTRSSQKVIEPYPWHHWSWQVFPPLRCFYALKGVFCSSSLELRSILSFQLPRASSLQILDSPTKPGHGLGYGHDTDKDTKTLLI